MLSGEGCRSEERSEQGVREGPGTSFGPRIRTEFKFRIKRGTTSAFRKARRLNKIAQQKMETIKRRAKEKDTNVQMFHVTDNEEDYLMPEDTGDLVKVEFVLVTRKSDIGIGRNELDRRFYLNRLREIGLNIMEELSGRQENKDVVKASLKKYDIPTDSLESLAHRVQSGERAFRMKKDDEFDIFYGIQAPEKLFEKYIHLLDIAERTCSTTGLDTVSKSTRIRIINFILRSTSVPGIGGLRELLKNKTFHSAFPLHEANIWKKEHVFQNKWANWKSLFTKQPINHIRLYFGERLALYYAWLGWYTMMLIPAAVCGIVVFVYGLINFGNNQVSKEICDAHTTIMCPQCDQRCSFWRLSDTCAYSKITQLFDQEITVLFSMFMGIWATIFLELWKRTRARVISDWDLFHWDEDEEELALGLIYNPEVPTVKYHYSFVRTGVVLFLACILITIIICIALGIVVFRIAVSVSLLRAPLAIVREAAKPLAVMISAVLHFVTILIMTKVSYVVARKLCQLEKQRTELAKENSFTVKMFTFQFFNMFASIIYTAFFLGRVNGYPGNYVRIGKKWRLEECHPSGCITDLFLQMSVIMVLKQVLGTTVEYAVPYFKYKWKCQKRFLRDNVEDITNHWIRNYNLGDFDSYSVFNEFLEMTIQYGFTTIFVAAFPLAPLLAFLNNVFEIRLDARKMIWHLKRPIPRKAKDIGIWLKILEVIGVLAVIGNGLVISLTSNFIPRQVYLYKYGPCGNQTQHKIDCMTGYVNNSLSILHLKNFEETIYSDDGSKLLGYPVTYCRYHDYRNEYTQDRTVQYWHILAARLAFLVLFENIAVCIKYVASWYIPEIPVSIQNENLQRTYEQLKEELKMIPMKSAGTSVANIQHRQMII
ncbi:anoctamin-9-like [Pristis pectinata]|uniref:anoctamin-9-like n=1 Tax=Pristis pectinata TaxID=685728 RepID=UPI00223D1295|nr:anoctamin-9-like [Pristis pectinata]